MKNTFKILFVAIIVSGILIQCNSTIKSSDQTKLINQNIIQQPVNYTTSDLEGDWTLIKTEVIEEKQSIERFKESGGDPEIPQEWTPPVFLNEKGILTPSYNFFSIKNRDLHIIEDSIFWLNYPLEVERRSSYSIEFNILKIKNHPDDHHIELNTAKDTLNISFLGAYGIYRKETYQKVTFNDSILNILRLYKTNLPLLAGKWEVFKEGNINNDGTEYRLDFPYKIPDSVQITKQELTAILLKGQTFKMMTDDKKRSYTLKYYDNELILSPYKWLPINYQGDKTIYLNTRLIIERQQLSPQECWAEFLQTITSGNIHNTIDLMTLDGYNDLRKNVDPQEMEITLKRRGQVWEDWEIKWEEISKTKAVAQFGPIGSVKKLKFVKINNLWKIDFLRDLD